jgi:OOP family OmpA-OmpF porin
MKVRIAGHTDSRGSDEYNQRLSEARAKSVCEYLISRGISADRLSYIGYGESRPIDTNDTEEGRQNNRRVELEILEN